MKSLLLISALVSATAFGQAAKTEEDPTPLFEGQREVRSLSEAARLGLNRGQTALDLWSGSYWPTYQGALAVRYRAQELKPLLEGKAQWDKHRELYEKLPLYSFIGRENELSPAEKYDLLVGDEEMTLTKYAWELGEKSNLGGKVKTWRGLCDGWASAAQMMPRPRKSVTLVTPKGLPLTFFPEDIKALGSQMYARSQGPVIFIGKRCRPVIGTFTGACDETNPGTFHRALLTRVGKLRKTFIADVSPGGEVWNYPVESYQVTYYNVFDDEESQDFETVKEAFDKKGRFARPGRRDPRTAFIVGVKLTVNYRDMRDANLSETDGPLLDKVLTKTYVYDLELDGQNNILRGESFSKNLPDFIWAPNDRTYPLSDAEERNASTSVVELSKVSAKRGQPLARIVERLFELAK